MFYSILICMIHNYLKTTYSQKKSELLLVTKPRYEHIVFLEADFEIGFQDIS